MLGVSSDVISFFMHGGLGDMILLKSGYKCEMWMLNVHSWIYNRSTTEQ